MNSPLAFKTPQCCTRDTITMSSEKKFISSRFVFVNDNYPSDINYMFQYTKRLLEILGVWPIVTRDKTRAGKLTSILLCSLCIGSMAFLLIPTSLHIALRVRDIVGARVSVGFLSPCVASVLKYAFIVYHAKEIGICMEHMKIDWMSVRSSNDRAIMLKNVRIEHLITAASALLLYTGGIFLHTVMPLLKGAGRNSLNRTVRPALVYPGYDLFVDTETSPTYEIIFCTICFSAFVRFTVSIAACNLTALFVTHACGQMQIVVARLETLFDDLGDDDNGKVIEKRVSFLVLCHARGLRLSSLIDEALKEMCLVEVVTATLILCLLEYYVLEWQNAGAMTTLTYFLLLISYTYNIFIFCHIGELLKEQLQEVGKSAYMIDWYRIPKRKSLFIVLIMAIANYPHKITAGGMIELSICTFGLIMKTSIIYQNMLRTFSQTDE